MENEQRRSARIMYSIPLSIRGMDEKGKPFEIPGRTITLNRHGARILASRSLKVTQTIHVTNQANAAAAEFRVVGPIAPPIDHEGEWGVECLRVDKNIWDIQFPTPRGDYDARVLLSCRLCQAFSLQSLSLVEVEVLETAGLLTKPCVHCGSSTPWGYPRQAFELETKAYQAAVTEATGGLPTLAAERRRTQRKAAQLPIRVRDYYGEVEFAQTENVSQDGLCFSTFTRYYVGQGIVVICPFDAGIEKPEARARIIRTDAEGGRYTYGVKYEQPPR